MPHDWTAVGVDASVRPMIGPSGAHSARDAGTTPARRLVTRVGVGAGDDVLDIGTGTGVVAREAWARGAHVTAIDHDIAALWATCGTADLLGFADIAFVACDAARLPFRDGAFDVVLSCFGHMFAPHQAAVADELARITRPGGRLAFAAWLPGPSGQSAPARTVRGGSRARRGPLTWGHPVEVERLLNHGFEAFGFEFGRSLLLPPSRLTSDSAHVARPPRSRGMLREYLLAYARRR